MSNFKPGETVYVRAVARGKGESGAELVTVESCDHLGNGYGFTIRALPETVSSGLVGLPDAKQQAVIEAARLWRDLDSSISRRELIDAVDALEPPKPVTAEDILKKIFSGDESFDHKSVAAVLRGFGLLKDPS